MKLKMEIWILLKNFKSLREYVEKLKKKIFFCKRLKESYNKKI